MALGPLTAFVIANGRELPADEYDPDLRQAAIDRANFMTRGEPLTAAGQRTGEVSFGGPYEGTLILERGDLAVLVFGITATLGIAITVRVTSWKVSNTKEQGPRWRITGAQHGAVGIWNGAVGALSLAGL